MPSATEPNLAPDRPPRPSLAQACADWNRKLHSFSGLYLLFFVWLFAFTGLLLNHPKWSFAEFWDSRRQTTSEHEITAPRADGDLAQARDIARQLGIRGEIEWTVTRSAPGRFDFRVSRPGHIFEIKTDLNRHRADVHEIGLNGWGVMRILHSFAGVRMDDSRNTRDWWLTSMWAFAMDAVAAGLIFMVLSGFYMWLERRQRRALGIGVAVIGLLTCGLFCVGLCWIY